jgi:hypothetical protein
VYNYAEDHWTVHTLNRAAGVDREVLPSPVFVSNRDASGAVGGGLLFEHETELGTHDRAPFVVSGPLELGEGDQIMRIQSMLPDENTVGDLSVDFITRFWPNDTPRTETVAISGSAPITPRVTGREVMLTFRQQRVVDWRLGHFRIGVRPQGSR